ncbi:MAG TPA: ATP-binding cassette domain-containing protein, partial [Ilumatobacteraceae bacterium]|nr:ATP-binding cassette domain-containing protein [Ilumatobacteraceae bacterium]
ERQLRDEAGDLLHSLQLSHLAFRPAMGLPFGTLKRLEIARALAARPTFLLMDEPASGLTHSEVAELSDTIVRVRDEFNLSVLLVEHHMAMVMSISDKVVAMEFGRKIAEGLPDEVRNNERVIAAYLSALLEVDQLVAGYGPIQVLHGLGLHVNEGEVAVMLGANGAGKTTTMRAISGMIARKGRVRFNGKDIVKASADEIVRLGVAQVPQGRGTFTDLSVEDNLRAGAFILKGNASAADLREWYDIFPRLEERKTQKAGSLSGGEQQMLAIGRALMSRP